MMKKICFLLLVLLAITPAGCRSTGNAPREVVATVDGAGIPLADFNDRLSKRLSLVADASSLSGEQIRILKIDVLNELIDERVMINRAEKLNITVSDAETAKRIEEIRKDYSAEEFDQLFKGNASGYRNWAEQLRRRLLLEKLVRQDVNARVVVTDEEVSSYYSSHLKEGISEERIHLSQIILPEREKAEAVLQRLKNGEDFAALAKEVSMGLEAEKGGDLGFFSQGVLPEAFDRVVFSLPPGKISRVVETPYGYHIFKVLERVKRGEGGAGEVKEKIRAKLRREKEEQEYGRWLEQLRTGAIVKVNESVLQSAGEKDRGKESAKNRPSTEWTGKGEE